jgi:hypothetical protein
MNRNVWMAMALAAVAVSGMSANLGPTITVTGCVQNFSAKGTVGTTEKGYLLTNATISSADDALALATVPTQGTTAAGTPTGTSGTAAAGMPTSATWVAATGTGAAQPPASRLNSSYLLDGHDGELKEHVGHKIEVTGTVQPREGDVLKTDESRLQVASIRLVSSTCSAKSK